MPEPMEVRRRIALLRSAMPAAGCAAYLIPASDPHTSEYMPAHYNAREYFSGFPCENSTLVVTKDKAALWVDGRYFVAAEAALRGTGIDMQRLNTAGTPTVEAYCAAALLPGEALGYCPDTLPLTIQRTLRAALAKKGTTLKALHLENALWQENRPALPATPAFLLSPQQTGKAPGEKLALLRAALVEAGCTAMLENRLDCVAWLCNLRAADIPDTPYALAFCWVTQQNAVLFLDTSRLPAADQAMLAAEGFSLRGYGALNRYFGAEGAAASGCEKAVPVCPCEGSCAVLGRETVLADPSSLTAAQYDLLAAQPGFTVVEKPDPILLLKAVKNETELACTREAHLRDAVCMVRFQRWLEGRLASAAPLREYDCCEALYALRSVDPAFVCLSFAPIAAWGPNAAMMHYMPQKGQDGPIERRGFLLVDSGTTCRDGTTDITRTYAVGPLTDEEKENYTRVLKCHIDMAAAVWKAGATGGELDMLARQPLWRHLLDYRCGTGHGVAHVGSVHEGPQSLRPHNGTVFCPGMVITDEPGLYEGGAFGIRIENELECRDAGDSEYGHFLCFAPLMWVPIDTAPVLPALLDTTELAWLNAYHQQVYEKLAPRLNDEERTWLRAKCAPLGV
ncbi:MAG: aminopeptidase P family protein [Faecalibacterium sp.]|nr:aminopeptidase P family protein [Faecalibacterium sp.]